MSSRRGSFSLKKSSAACFSFHCCICFEPFDAEVNYPVVLPCGHTYLCVNCSKRLDRCMVCRKSLLDINSISAGPSSPNSPPIHVSHPKNLVLLSLIESTARNLCNKHRNNAGTTIHEDHVHIENGDIETSFSQDIELEFRADSSNNDGLAGDNDNDDENDINSALSLVGGDSTCGTYVVLDNAGLPVLKNKPEDDEMEEDFFIDSSECSSECEKKEKISGKKRFFSLKKHNKQKSKNEVVEDDGPEILRYGDRVQIVVFEKDWATLARKRGYLYAPDSSQLVKVGAPSDRACLIEAALLLFKKEKRDINELSREIESRMDGLNQNLRSAIRKDAPVSVPSSVTVEHLPPLKIPIHPSSEQKQTHGQPTSPTPNIISDQSLETPSPLATPRSPTSPVDAPSEISRQGETLSSTSVFAFPFFNFAASRSPAFPPSPSATSQASVTSTSSAPYNVSSQRDLTRSVGSTGSNRDVNFRHGWSSHNGVNSSRTHRTLSHKEYRARTGISDHRGASASRSTRTLRLHSVDTDMS